MRSRTSASASAKEGFNHVLNDRSFHNFCDMCLANEKWQCYNYQWNELMIFNSVFFTHAHYELTCPDKLKLTKTTVTIFKQFLTFGSHLCLWKDRVAERGKVLPKSVTHMDGPWYCSHLSFWTGLVNKVEWCQFQKSAMCKNWVDINLICLVKLKAAYFACTIIYAVLRYGTMQPE